MTFILLPNSPCNYYHKVPLAPREVISLPSNSTSGKGLAGGHRADPLNFDLECTDEHARTLAQIRTRRGTRTRAVMCIAPALNGRAVSCKGRRHRPEIQPPPDRCPLMSPARCVHSNAQGLTSPLTATRTLRFDRLDVVQCSKRQRPPPTRCSPASAGSVRPDSLSMDTRANNKHTQRRKP